MKKCSICKVEKEKVLFTLDKRKKEGIGGQCKECYNRKKQEYRNANPEKIKEIRAVRIENKLNVDGILNEPEWALAAVSPRFVQIEPEQGKPAHFETKIKVLYNF